MESVFQSPASPAAAGKLRSALHLPFRVYGFDYRSPQVSRPATP